MPILLEAQNTEWVTEALTEALARIMPEEHPGQHALMAMHIDEDWTSQAGLAVRLFLISNNFPLSDNPPDYELHGQHVLALVDQVITAVSNLKDLERFLRAPGLVSDAIRTKVLPWAIRTGHDDIVRFLLSLGCKPDPEKRYPCQFSRWRRNQSLEVAAWIKDKQVSTRMIRTLLEYGANIDKSLICNALNIAISRGNQEVIQLLMAAGACLSSASLAAAIQAGSDEMVRKVLDTGVVDSINDELPTELSALGLTGWAALAHAAHRGYLHIVKTLLARGADVTAVTRLSNFRYEFPSLTREHCTTALGIAVAAGQVETARFLAQHMSTGKGKLHVPPGYNYLCPLTIACLVGNGEIAKMFLEARELDDVSGADIAPSKLAVRLMPEKERFHYPETLLEILIMTLKGSEEQLVELCEMLLHRGARTDKALGVAVEEGKVEVARLLLRHGASPDIVLPGRVSVFGLAIQMGNLSLARMLHQAGATEMGYLCNIKGAEMAEFLDGVGLLNLILREQGWSILSEAIRGEDKSQWLVDRILETELDFTGKYIGVLAAAVEGGLNASFIDAMIDRGAAWTTHSLYWALVTAIKIDTPDDIMHALLATYTRVDQSTLTSMEQYHHLSILLSVARYGSRRILGIFLKAVDWNPGDLGVALGHAICNANYRVIQGLLDAGASLGGQ